MFAEENNKLMASNWHSGFNISLLYHLEIDHDERKNNNEIKIPVQIVNENSLDKSSLVSSLFCTIAGDIPISVKTLKKFIIIVAMATTPKSSGESNRDRTAVTTNDITMPEYLAIAV